MGATCGPHRYRRASSRGATVTSSGSSTQRVAIVAKAYWIATYQSVKNPEALAKYAKLSGPAMRAHLGSWDPSKNLRGWGPPAHGRNRVRQCCGCDSRARQSSIPSRHEGAERLRCSGHSNCRRCGVVDPKTGEGRTKHRLDPFE